MNLDWTTASHTLIKIFARTTLNLPWDPTEGRFKTKNAYLQQLCSLCSPNCSTFPYPLWANCTTSPLNEYCAKAFLYKHKRYCRWKERLPPRPNEEQRYGEDHGGEIFWCVCARARARSRSRCSRGCVFECFFVFMLLVCYSFCLLGHVCWWWSWLSVFRFLKKGELSC